MSSKKYLRGKMLGRRSGLSPVEVERVSRCVCSRLWDLVLESGVRAVGGYMGLNNELELSCFLRRCLREGVHVYLPRFVCGLGGYEFARVMNLEGDLESGKYSVLEPTSSCLRAGNLNCLDMIVVPGVAFDLEGNRMGMGMGYYDRMLAGYGGLKIGVGYSWQVLDRVPVDENDVGMDLVVAV